NRVAGLYAWQVHRRKRNQIRHSYPHLPKEKPGNHKFTRPGRRVLVATGRQVRAAAKPGPGKRVTRPHQSGPCAHVRDAVWRIPLYKNHLTRRPPNHPNPSASNKALLHLLRSPRGTSERPRSQRRRRR
uniref:Uncharacterized protein n=2 Tax=Aegilops tauschii subsp. strangulata TaxID=200361 RepID=A0A453B777_AEGTS